MYVWTTGIRADEKRAEDSQMTRYFNDLCFVPNSGHLRALVRFSKPRPFIDLRGNEETRGGNAGIRTVGLQDTEDLVTCGEFD